VAFGAVNTAIGLAEDLQKGLIERFRSLPMARSAVMAGRTIAGGVVPHPGHLDLRVVGVRVAGDHASLAPVVRRAPAAVDHRRRPPACTIGGPTATLVFQSVLWSVAIIAVFAPIAVRRYRRVA
jgi:hypothetical protein